MGLDEEEELSDESGDAGELEESEDIGVLDESDDIGSLEELESGLWDEIGEEVLEESGIDGEEIESLGVDTPVLSVTPVLSLGMVEEVLLQAAKEKAKSPNTTRCFAFMIIPPLLLFS